MGKRRMKAILNQQKTGPESQNPIQPLKPAAQKGMAALEAFAIVWMAWIQD